MSGKYPLPIGGIQVGRVYAPQIISIRPSIAIPVRFPFTQFQTIMGDDFWRGTEAYELARRATTLLQQGMERVGIRHRPPEPT